MSRMGMGELKRWEGLLAGRHLYQEPGCDPLLVQVHYIEGLPMVEFLDAEDEDQGELYDARDMAGEFTKVR